MIVIIHGKLQIQRERHDNNIFSSQAKYRFQQYFVIHEMPLQSSGKLYKRLPYELLNLLQST